MDVGLPTILVLVERLGKVDSYIVCGLLKMVYYCVCALCIKKDRSAGLSVYLEYETVLGIRAVCGHA